MRLSGVEIIAVVFAGIAGLASAAQAYVSWETRGEVARAIVFSEQLDACAQLIAAIRPFSAKARAADRETVAQGPADGRYSLPGLYYGVSAGTPGFDRQHEPRVERWRVAAAAFEIVAPAPAVARLDYFDQLITEEIERGAFMDRADMLAWLERLDGEATAMVASCRALLAPSDT